MSLSDLTGQKDAYQLLYEAREEIKRLQRQVDRLGKDKAKLQSQLLEARVGTPGPGFGSFNEYRQSEKDRY